MIAPTADILAAALKTAASGYYVLPIDRATGRPEPTAEAPSRDPTTVNAWWKHFPLAQLAIATGAINRIVSIRINGPTGLHSLWAFLDRFSWNFDLPDTSLCRCGNHWDLIWRHPPTATPPLYKRLADGLELLGEGGYVIIPPSVNAIGQQCQWPQPRHKLAELPAGLIDHIADHERSTAALRAIADSEKAPISDKAAGKMAGSFRKANAKLQHNLKCVMEGEYG